MRILVVRPDRMGDVILSTPCFAEIKKKFPTAHLTVLVQKPIEPLLKGLPEINEIWIYKKDKMKRLVSEFKKRRFDVVVHLQVNREIAWASFFAKVPKRIGPYSKWYSYIVFNQGVRQRRSLVKKHEAEYNLELLKKLGIHAPSARGETRIFLSKESEENALQWLKEKGWDGKEFILVHPGMGGSALNWRSSYYLELIKKLAEQDGYNVLLSFGPADQKMLQEFSGALPKNVLIYDGVASGNDAGFLAALMSQSSLVIAPSTGPLHIAVALKKPVVTLYPPIRVQSQERWGPYSVREGGAQAIVHVPTVKCNAALQCLKEACPDYVCMDKVSVNQVYESVKKVMVSL